MLDHILYTFYSLASRLVFFFDPNKSIALKEKRMNLVKDLLELVNKHIENVDPKYKKERILYNHENEEKMTEERIFIRRNSMRRSSNNLGEQVRQVIVDIHENKENIVERICIRKGSMNHLNEQALQNIDDNHENEKATKY